MTMNEGLTQRCRELEAQIHWLRRERGLLRAILLILSFAAITGWLS